jgi:hypothetical protein
MSANFLMATYLIARNKICDEIAWSVPSPANAMGARLISRPQAIGKYYLAVPISPQM